MKHKTMALFSMLVVTGVLAGGGLASLLLPKPTHSEIERRALATLPAFTWESFFSGEYLRGFEAYYADTFPTREGLISLAFGVQAAKGINRDASKLYDTTQPTIAPLPQPPAPPQADGNTNQPPAPPEDPGQGYTSQGVFVYKDRAFSLFGGNNAVGSYYAKTLSSYAAELPGVRCYNLLAPTAGEFYFPKHYASLWKGQAESIAYISSQLVGVTPVDAMSTLSAHTQEYIYFRTDHHWTGLGAYYAYTAFAKAAGFTPLKLEDFEHRTLPNEFLGTLYNLTQDANLAANPDRVEYYIPPTAYTAQLIYKDAPYYPMAFASIWGEQARPVNSYSVFLGGDYPLISITTRAGTGRRLLIVKESYGNALAPYMLPHYDEIYIVDQRYFQTSLYRLIEEKRITDILFVNNIFAANTQYHVDCIASLKHQVWTPPEEESQPEDGEILYYLD